MFSEDREIAIKKFIEFNEAKHEVKCLDDRKERLTDEEAKVEISKIISLVVNRPNTKDQW